MEKTNRYRFYKDNMGRWFINIPEWEGKPEDLEMVMGADTLLDVIAQGDDSVSVKFSTEPFEGANILIIEKHGGEESGAYYLLSEYRGIKFNLQVWLCDVTLFVFGYFPNRIYFN